MKGLQILLCAKYQHEIKQAQRVDGWMPQRGNEKGPKLDPCRTPLLISRAADLILFDKTI